MGRLKQTQTGASSCCAQSCNPESATCTCPKKRDNHRCTNSLRPFRPGERNVPLNGKWLIVEQEVLQKRWSRGPSTVRQVAEAICTASRSRHPRRAGTARLSGSRHGCVSV